MMTGYFLKIVFYNFTNNYLLIDYVYGHHQQNYIRLAGLAGLGPDRQNLSEIQICQKLIRIFNYSQNLETISYLFIYFRNQSLSSFHCFFTAKDVEIN